MKKGIQGAVWLLYGVVAGGCAGPLCPGAAAPGASEAEVKAAMLYNFVKFVAWPEGTMAPGAPFLIGVSGSGSFASVLARTVADRTVQGRPVAVREVTAAAEMQACQAVFIAGGDPGRGAAAAEALRRSAVLMVGEAPGFARRGGMIGFVLVENRTRFEINLEASVRAGLKVSSKLLRLASVVREEE